MSVHDNILEALREIARHTVTVVVHPADAHRVEAELVGVPMVRVIVSDAGRPGSLVVFDGGLLEPGSSPLAS